MALLRWTIRGRKVVVWIPGREGPYHVVYGHDGQNLFEPETSFAGVDWGLDEALQAAADLPATLAVGIHNTPERMHEYLPEHPLADRYLRFLLDEVRPRVERSFEIRNSYLLGSSMGGLISLYGLCQYPDRFAGAACVSTHWPANSASSLDYLRSHVPAPGSNRLYFDYGTETADAPYEPLQKKADAILRQAGWQAERDFLTLKFPGADHSEGAWRARVHRPLKFLLSES